jgi:predicted ATPase/DNA-binding CsgD family transcriptional regulator
MTTTSARRFPGNLPVPLSAFIGRHAEAAQIRRMLSNSRLVTLTGVGGVGKTRLALHVAADLPRAFPDGTWMVELASLQEPGLLTDTIASGLGIRDQSTRWPVATLSDYLAERQLLLLLDNCEHLLDACAVLVDALLRSAPQLRILATSRQPLDLPAERIVNVPPLALPDLHTDVSAAALAGNEAVTLFVLRAASVVPGFALTDSNAPAVVALCARLDGLPLALELAAVRLRALSPEQLLERLDERFRLLSTGSRAALPRQQTLRGLVDWSFALCSPAEQTMWARLSVFAGSFSLEAAEQVCADAAVPREAVLDLVAALLDKSVLVREEHESGVRYRLLETMREYGRERLVDSGSEVALRRRHRDYYLLLTERACHGLFGPEGPSWLERMRVEHANLRAALGFCLSEAGEVGPGLQLAAVFWFGWRELGLLSEGRRWLDRLLAAQPDLSVTRANALWADASLAVLQGDTATAKALLAEASSLAEALGEEAAGAYAAVFSGQVAMLEGDTATAERLLRRALAVHRASGDTIGVAVALIRLAMAASATGDGDNAIRLSTDYVALCIEHGAVWLTPFGRFVQAVEFWRRGDPGQAVDRARDAVRGHWANHDRIGAAMALEVLTWAAAEDGNPERTARLLGALDNVWRTVGPPLFGYPHLMVYHEECERRCARVLGEDAFVAARRRGSALEFDGAVAYGLQEQQASLGRDVHRSPLTRREDEVADLVAKGMSNKEIAESLVISARTAETHVEHILTKLGFSSRTQIATWVTARQRDMGDGVSQKPAPA